MGNYVSGQVGNYVSVTPPQVRNSVSVDTLIGALATSGVALLNETPRRRAAATDSDRSALRGKAADVFVHIFNLQHEMEWMRWQAAQRPESLDVSVAAAYESAVQPSIR